MHLILNHDALDIKPCFFDCGIPCSCDASYANDKTMFYLQIPDTGNMRTLKHDLLFFFAFMV